MNPHRQKRCGCSGQVRTESGMGWWLILAATARSAARTLFRSQELRLRESESTAWGPVFLQTTSLVVACRDAALGPHLVASTSLMLFWSCLQHCLLKQ